MSLKIEHDPLVVWFIQCEFLANLKKKIQKYDSFLKQIINSELDQTQQFIELYKSLTTKIPEK